MTRKIDKLFTDENSNLPLLTRYPRKLLDTYAADIARIVELKADGKCIPAIHTLKDFFQDTYGMSIGEASIRRHLKLVEKGQQIWPK